MYGDITSTSMVLLNAPSVKQEVVNSPVKQSTHVGSSDILPHPVLTTCGMEMKACCISPYKPRYGLHQIGNAFYVHQGCRGVLRSITAETHQLYDRLKDTTPLNHWPKTSTNGDTQCPPYQEHFSRDRHRCPHNLPCNMHRAATVWFSLVVFAWTSLTTWNNTKLVASSIQFQFIKQTAHSNATPIRAHHSIMPGTQSPEANSTYKLRISTFWNTVTVSVINVRHSPSSWTLDSHVCYQRISNSWTAAGLREPLIEPRVTLRVCP